MRDISSDLHSLEIKDSKGRIHVPDHRMVDIALRIIDLYKTSHQMYTGYEPRISKASLIYFYRAALLTSEYDISPEELVTRQFKSMSRIGVYRPTALSSFKLLEESFETFDLRLDELRRYKANIELYNSRTRLYGSELALRDSTNEFSPLFRVVMASRLGLREVVEAYYDDALTELRNTPVAKDIFQGDLSFLKSSDRT